MRNKPLILVVDDESHILHVVELKLRNAGFEVVTAMDGEEGLEIAVQQKPDLVITDLQMPVMSGTALCAAMKAHPATQHTPALVITARGFKLEQEALDTTNIQAVLSKPFSPREVLCCVNEILAGGLAASSTEVEPTS